LRSGRWTRLTRFWDRDDQLPHDAITWGPRPDVHPASDLVRNQPFPRHIRFIGPVSDDIPNTARIQIFVIQWTDWGFWIAVRPVFLITVGTLGIDQIHRQALIGGITS
jgi:hypothetical protein